MIGSEGVDPRFFHDVYEGEAPWDIGHPQPEVLNLLDQGGFQGSVLDVGCGTGENAMLLARQGLKVTAVDFVPSAVDQANDSARMRGLNVDWRVGDALCLAEVVREQYDTVLDSGVFHVFSDADRPVYINALGAVTRPGGRLHIIVFSDAEGGDDGPRRVTRAELESAFTKGWELEEMVETRYGIRSRDAGARAWRGTWRRL